MSAAKNTREDSVLFPKTPQMSRRRNNEITVQCLMEEAFEGAFFGRELWSEVEREVGEASAGWEAPWSPGR